MKAKMIPVESFYQGGDTEAKATERYLRGGFGSLKTKVAYKRYAEYVEWLHERDRKNAEYKGTDLLTEDLKPASGDSEAQSGAGEKGRL